MLAVALSSTSRSERVIISASRTPSKSGNSKTEVDPSYPCERHEIALEPHWFRVQTERIKRCNSQAKKDY
ncbi:BZ3500_MvSof-1268-A1-R1_Chr1-1g00917 [Microbotryum saponariae]|uniref:BZ3500_MvSof-1268-A1-R1_Chr1-1g00917 protein n=1 Tax=Microbotryum saponariae TaxID=289078 RepID=A0A2X0KA16_9BASI|nr:BZ3500_MvSof-1268-A1-R1_Chr1-1g00917 [Microbotryum saponariae]SCZ92932.1 BZ3501_MvSof-1269-A2-R1_Chr1-1g00514 [Microbotryum saponariae]